MLQIKVVGVYFFFFFQLSFTSRKLLLVFYDLSLVSRHFRDSRNEREPAETAPGDHVSHQADNREAYLGQAQQDGIRRGRLGPLHTRWEPCGTQWEQTYPGSSEVREPCSEKIVSLCPNCNSR